MLASTWLKKCSHMIDTSTSYFNVFCAHRRGKERLVVVDICLDLELLGSVA